MLCGDGPMKTLVSLALVPERRRGHGALYTRLNHGRLDVGRLRRASAGAVAEGGRRPPGPRGRRLPVAAAGRGHRA
ncbi:hypothetical protein [Streptosporangium nondiastaticum]|uniref:hypothetical protein n=1 Tax=Streptosporangium nondiastaticum TaxID=35764 RepID=UPI00257044F3|nr:hypothetical protein [Streptosporangium nondiastaticum]